MLSIAFLYAKVILLGERAERALVILYRGGAGKATINIRRKLRVRYIVHEFKYVIRYKVSVVVKS